MTKEVGSGGEAGLSLSLCAEVSEIAPYPWYPLLRQTNRLDATSTSTGCWTASSLAFQGTSWVFVREDMLRGMAGVRALSGVLMVFMNGA